MIPRKIIGVCCAERIGLSRPIVWGNGQIRLPKRHLSWVSLGWASRRSRPADDASPTPGLGKYAIEYRCGKRPRRIRPFGELHLARTSCQVLPRSLPRKKAKWRMSNIWISDVRVFTRSGPRVASISHLFAEEQDRVRDLTSKLKRGRHMV